MTNTPLNKDILSRQTIDLAKNSRVDTLKNTQTDATKLGSDIQLWYLKEEAKYKSSLATILKEYQFRAIVKSQPIDQIEKGELALLLLRRINEYREKYGKFPFKYDKNLEKKADKKLKKWFNEQKGTISIIAPAWTSIEKLMEWLQKDPYHNEQLLDDRNNSIWISISLPEGGWSGSYVVEYSKKQKKR